MEGMADLEVLPVFKFWYDVFTVFFLRDEDSMCQVSTTEAFWYFAEGLGQSHSRMIIIRTIHFQFLGPSRVVISYLQRARKDSSRDQRDLNTVRRATCERELLNPWGSISILNPPKRLQ